MKMKKVLLGILIGLVGLILLAYGSLLVFPNLR